MQHFVIKVEVNMKIISMIKTLFLLLFVNSMLNAQIDVLYSGNADAPKFNYDLLNFYSFANSQSRLDILIQMPYKNLQFKKDFDTFVASYEVEIFIREGRKTLIDRSYSRTIKTPDFKNTSSVQTYDLSQKSYELKPGKYEVEMTVTDDDSKKAYRIVQKVTIRDFSKPMLSISDPMFISKINEVEGKKMIVPNVSNNVGNIEDEFYTFFEIYSASKLNDSITVKYAILDKEEVVYAGSVNQYIDDNVIPCFLTLDKKDLIFGNYFLQIELVSDKYKEILNKQQLKKMFTIRWQDLPISVNNLDLAIRQVSYIATPSEISKMESGKTQKEKLENFLAFWKNRKPSMEEYFARVDYANEKFKNRRDGWKTDMGMVFIIFGSPDYIDRHPFELGSQPYEIWDYYAVNRRFIFVDETGFGDYRSVYPIWDTTVRVN